MKLKEGQILIAIKNFANFCTKGKKYKIIKILSGKDYNRFVIIDDTNGEHTFEFSDLNDKDYLLQIEY